MAQHEVHQHEAATTPDGSIENALHEHSGRSLPSLEKRPFHKRSSIDIRQQDRVATGQQPRNSRVLLTANFKVAPPAPLANRIPH